MVYFITGRKGAGKTYQAMKLKEKLQDLGEAVLVLDGDDFRQRVADYGYTDEGREKNILTIARIAALAEAQGIAVIIALVSPRKYWRQSARSFFKESQLIYVTGGSLWKNTEYEEPDQEENPTVIEGMKAA